jgi:hypothetical protein
MLDRRPVGPAAEAGTLMEVLPHAAGPQDAITATTPRRAGSIRRTTNIDTLRPDGLRADAVVEARARDLRTNVDGTSEVVAEVTLQARISPTRELLSLGTSPEIPALQGLLGASVGPGFRSRVNEIVADGCEDGSLLYLLLDDLPGATLVSGYALVRATLDEGPHSDIHTDTDRFRPAPPGGSVTGPFPDFGAQDDICAGWAHDATMMVHVRETGSLPVTLGPPAPTLEDDTDPLSWHVMADLAPHAVRRRRRLDLLAPLAGEREHGIDLHFRDSHVDGRGSETIMHEYTMSGAVDLGVGRIGSVSARAHVLPWVECPGALASAQRIDGMDLSALRTRVRKEFVGRSTCTHLNDSLRSLADVTALHLALGMPPA